MCTLQLQISKSELDHASVGDAAGPRFWPLSDVADCFIAIRDELMLPDTEEIVDHIRSVLEQQQAAADVLTDRVIGGSRRSPLAAPRLHQMMQTLAADVPAEVAVGFARLVEAAHGIGA